MDRMDRVEAYNMPDRKQSEGPALAQTRRRRVLLALGTLIVATALIVALVVGLSPQAAEEDWEPRPCGDETNYSASTLCSKPDNSTCPGDMVFSSCGGCPTTCGQRQPLVCAAVCRVGCFCPCWKPWTDKNGTACYAEASQCPSLG